MHSMARIPSSPPIDPPQLISGNGLDISARTTCRRMRKSMAPILIVRTSRVFAPGFLCLRKVRSNGSQLRL